MSRMELLPNVRPFGLLLPIDGLRKILAGKMSGMADSDYHLAGERKTAAINRSWQKMLGLWRSFRQIAANLADSETGASQTRENLLLPLFQELGYGRLSAARPEERLVSLPDGAKANYAISHFRDESPIHLVGVNVSLDRKSAGVKGAARQSPHSLVQEFLNHSDRHLWGFVANGKTLRILRDNASLSQQAYVEFNLEGIFSGESFSEFALLWLCCHHSRVHTDNQPPEICWLERWREEAHSASIQALDSLRDNVTGCLEILGQGFISQNPALAAKLASGNLERQDYFRQLLRLAYRLIFLLVLEERRLLHGPDTDKAALDCYYQYWSLSRLANLAAKIGGTRHYDLWEGIKIIMQGLGRKEGVRQLGLAPMGSFLWSDAACPDITGLRLTNRDLLSAMRKLAFTTFGGGQRPVDWQHLGASELGSVYEALLELSPEISQGRFELTQARGNERKTSGSYYTPTELIDCLLATSLEPVINAAVKSAQPEIALLGLRVCDPACGSGHFLLAACRRIARRLAQLRSGDSEPSQTAMQDALREVAANCIYGIDINPMAVELCKVGLWLETHEPGKPLSFLDHHIICANSLFGTNAEAIRAGIPPEAYAPLQGSDKKAVSSLKKAGQRRDQALFEQFANEAQAVISAVRPLELAPANTLAEMEEREQKFRDWQKSPEWQTKKLLYDLWTAAFALPAHFPETGRILPDGSPELSDKPFGIGWQTLVKCVSCQKLEPGLVEAVEKTARESQFFHLEVMFPEVAAKGGFDAVIGNPPWEHNEIKEREWFTAHNREDIAELSGNNRKRAIEHLKTEDSLLYSLYASDQREYQVTRHFYANSGIYPLCGLGRINLYAVFAEWMRKNLNDSGRLGCIVPSGIATDDTTKLFFQDLVRRKSLVSLHDFENKNIFPSVHSSYKFSLLSCGSGARPFAENAEFVFFAHETADLRKPEKRFTLSEAEIRLLNPNTGTCPIFRTAKDAVLTKAVYRRHPVLIREGENGKPAENPWGIKFRQGLFNMTTDSHLFRTKEQLTDTGFELCGNIFEKGREKYLPLYEAKMIHHFSHRWATYENGKKGPQTRDVSLQELQNPDFCVMPRYWVAGEEVSRQLEAAGWQHGWLIGYRKISRSTDERTFIASSFPYFPAGDSINIIFTPHKDSIFLPPLLSSLAFDYISRMKLGGTNMAFFIANQLPVIHPRFLDEAAPWQPDLTIADWLRPRVLELTYTSHDLAPFARDLGYDGPPFAFDEERRSQIRAELDAAFFRLYLPANPDGSWKRCENENEAAYAELASAFPGPRDAVEYMMDSFLITKRKDEEKYGSYRTKELVLAEYERLN